MTLDEALAALTPDVRFPKYALPTAVKKRRRETLEEARYAALLDLAESVKPTLKLACDIVDALAEYGSDAELVALWSSHPASRVRRHAGEVILKSSGRSALFEAFEPSFLASLDPNLCCDPLFIENVATRKWGMEQARDELLALATGALLQEQSAPESFRRLAPLFDEAALAAETGAERAHSILRALLARAGRFREPPMRGWLHELSPLIQGGEPLDGQWIDLLARLLDRRPFIATAATVLEIHPHDRATDVLMARAEKGNQLPMVWESIDALGRRRAKRAVPLLRSLLGRGFDIGTTRSITEALLAIDNPPVTVVASEKKALQRPLNPLQPPTLPSVEITRRIRETWNRIESWLATNAPRVLRGLGDPASAAAISAAEETMGFRFPPDFRASLAVHDGEKTDVGAIKGLRLNSLEDLLSDWEIMEELRQSGTFDDSPSPEGLKPGHWNRGWLPVASDGGGNSLSMDLDPAAGGVAGQIFFFDHEQGPEPIVASSFGDWLARYAADLENEKVIVRAGSLEPVGG